MPGLKISHVIASDKKLKDEFLNEFDRIGYSQQSIFGLVGALSAYKYGKNWLNEVRDYIYKNILFIEEYLNKYLPKIKFIKPEGTYLIWLNFKEYKLNDKELDDLITNKAKLWLDLGIIFGRSGSGYERINVATNRDLIKRMLDSLYSVFKDL
jgi:cystathionine beta-lyase